MEVFFDCITRHIGPPLHEVRRPIFHAMPVHNGWILRPTPDALAKDGTRDAVWRPLHQLPGKAAADAVADEEELPDPEVVHQPELIIREGVPRVARRNRSAGLPA